MHVDLTIREIDEIIIFVSRITILLMLYSSIAKSTNN